MRVAAQRIEDGQVQFAVRVADGAGGWSEPVQPRIISFAPSARRANRWLSSSPLTLERVDDAPSLIPTRSFVASEIDPVDLHLVSLEWSGDIRYEAVEEDGELYTTVSIYSLASGTVDGELRVDLTCDQDGLSAMIGGLPSGERDARSVTWSVDGGRSRTEQWSPWPVEGGLELFPPTNSVLADAILSQRWSIALSIGQAEISTTLELTALQAAPVYSNLTDCGAPQSAQLGDTETRIQAYLHQESGSDPNRARIEFALQQRGDDDQWGERILLSARRMLAYGDPHNWLSSTPVSVTCDLESVERAVNLIGTDEAVDPTDLAVSPRLGADASAGGVEFEATFDGESASVESHLRQHSNGPLVLEVSCADGQRSVSLSGIREDAGDSLSFELDDQESSVQWKDGAFDDERVIQRLTDASTLTVGEGSSTESTFDVSGLFSSPIQRNLDQCGGYTDPAWTPVTTEQDGRIGDDVGYSLVIRDHRGRGVEDRSSVIIDWKIGLDCFGAAAPSGSWLQSYVWPASDLAVGTYTARIKIDGTVHEGEWEFRKWSDDGPLHISRQQIDTYHDLLFSASTIEFRFGGQPRATQEIDLTSVFTSPVQINIENCGAPLWPDANDYVPNVDAHEAGLVPYNTGVDRLQPDSVHTNASTVSREEATRHFQIRISCTHSNELVVVISPLSELEAGRSPVTYRIDDGPEINESWQSVQHIDREGIVTWSGSASNPKELIARLRLATTLSIEVMASGLEPINFDLAGLFETPLRENIDNCGFNVEGETRMLPPAATPLKV